jgi:quinol monooxygenase YgiN
MTYVVTYIDIQPSFVNKAIDAIRRYKEAHNAIALRETSRPNRFVIVEASNDETHVQLRSIFKDIENSPADQRIHLSFAVSERPLETAQGGFAAVTHVDVPPPRREETETLLRTLAEQSRKHTGNLRYEVFQQLAPRTNHFTVLAVWSGETAFASHELHADTRQFREALGPMLGAPYDERLFKELA